ncbi:putative reverse transcriptase zinc-binding domain-containing protein [Helianthus annuus]|nr:putative reverse transcriptase zinc-binding domain-containing protein [Helianthus annuus]
MSANTGVIEPVAYVWNSWTPPKVNFLLWRALLGKIASKMGLQHRGVLLSDVLCPRCGLCDEDLLHIFVNCLWSKSIWWSILTWLRVSFPFNIGSIDDLIGYIKSQPGDAKWKKMVYTIALATVWRIWLARNEKAFKDNSIPVSKSVDHIKEDAFIWIFNRSKLKSPSWGKWLDFDIAHIL